jgi:hypothetical protein
MPYDGAYDEHDHVVRAAGVVRGQLLVAPSADGKNGRYQTVPRSLVPPNFDCQRAGGEPATCLGTPPDDRTPTRVHTRAGHYNPVYYAVVGWPLAALPTMTGVIAARLVSALLCATLLATALVMIWPMTRHRLLMLVLLLVTTPTLVALNGLLNPSGLEISAAVLLWAALTRLLSRASAASDASDASETNARVRGASASIVISGAVLALARPAGVLVVGAIVLLGLVAAGGRIRPRELLRRRDVRLGAAVVGAAMLLALAWAAVAQVGSVGTEAPADQRSLGELVRFIVLSRFDYWVRQTIGIFAYATVGLPVWVVAGWVAVQGFVVLLGVAYAGRRHAYTILAIPVACLAGGFVVELVFLRVIGSFMQGRYFMPLWVGMFFLAALAVPARLLPERGLRRLYVVGTGLWALATAAGLYVTLRHYEYGNRAVAEAAGGWRPMVGEAVPHAVNLVGIALVGWLVWRYLARHREPERTGAAPTGSVVEARVVE